MSLVELAIKKMQAAARGGSEPEASVESPLNPHRVPDAQIAGRAPGVIGAVVATGLHRTLSSPLPQHRTDKLLLLDRVALRMAGLLPPENQQRVLADQYRHIKRPLIAAATGRGGQRLDKGQLIMMASAMPGEGKTFTSINLALSMALEKDISVLLVDADVPKPHLSRTLGVDSEPGLLDILCDPQISVESVIIPTDVPNLSILPAGVRSDTATELLASHRMEEIVNHLASSNPSRIVVIDSPPLLLTSEAGALAQWVGQIVVVVRAGLTPQLAVMDAIALLGESRSIGLILNQSDSATPGYYYGYGDVNTPGT